MKSLTQTFSRFLQNYFGRFRLVVVYLFLYTPLFFLILFSFNSTRQDGIFTGFGFLIGIERSPWLSSAPAQGRGGRVRPASASAHRGLRNPRFRG